MKANILFATGLLFVAFGIYIGLNDSELCFGFLVVGIVIWLFAADAAMKQAKQ